MKAQPPTVDLTFDNYDPYGNILQFTSKDGVSTSYLWGYNGLYPVAELKNISYASIPNTYKSNVQINNPGSDGSLSTLLDGLRNHFFSENEISTYTYQRLVGITSHTAANGQKNYYEYDQIGRLRLQRDHSQKVIKLYEYNMKGPSDASVNQLWSSNEPIMRFYSFPGSSYYTKQVYNLIVPGGIYKASSVQAANELARYEAEGLTAPPWGLPPSSIKSNTAELTIAVSTMVGNNMPSNIEIDFIRDGTVVATERVYSKPSYLTTMYMEEGSYQIVVRPSPDTNYFGDFLTYRISTMHGSTSFTFRSGDTIHIEKHQEYMIDIMN